MEIDFSGVFTYMHTEISLVAVIVIAFLYDLAAGSRGRQIFHPLMCILMLLFIAANIVPFPEEEGEIFGGMFIYSPVYGIVKSILAIGTLIVFLQSDSWLSRADTSFKRGEFYVLTLSTLLGMYFMISAGHFLMFFIGMELATVPMACLVALDKYRNNAAEAGAKFILSALFSSGLMLYGISFFYGTTGTLYFNDMASRIDGSALQILSLVFFFAGLGFKISLVPFHLWTADTYQGAPTNVTSYLSVISKGAAAFTLMVVLFKVFAEIAEQWQLLLYSLIFYVLIYMAANLAAFGVISSIEQHSGGKVGIDDYNGLYRTNPKLAITMTLALFSLGGIPPFAGFFSKFFIFASAFEAGFHVLVLIALLNTIIALYYYLLIVKAMFIIPNDTPIAAFRSDTGTRISLVLCLAGVLVIGLVSSVFDSINLFTFGM